MEREVAARGEAGESPGLDVGLAEPGNRPRMADQEPGKPQQTSQVALGDGQGGEEALLVGKREVRERLGEDVGCRAVRELEADREPADVGRVVGDGGITAAVREADLRRHRRLHVAGAGEPGRLRCRGEGSDAVNALGVQRSVPIVGAEPRVDVPHRLVRAGGHGPTLSVR